MERDDRALRGCRRCGGRQLTTGRLLPSTLSRWGSTCLLQNWGEGFFFFFSVFFVLLMWTLFKSSSNWLQCCSVSCVWSPLAAGSWDPSSPMGVNLQPLTGGAVLTTGPPGKSLNSSSRKTLGPGSASNSRGDGLCCLRPRLVPQSVLDAPQCTLQEALPFAVLQALSGR